MRISKYLGIAAALSVFTATLVTTPLFADSANPEKYDTVLKMAMASKDGGERLSKMTLGKQDGQDSTVRVLIKTDDQGQEVTSFLSRVSGSINSRHGDIISITLPYKSLPGLSSLNSVKRIEASVNMLSCNDKTKGTDGINIASILETNSNYTGSGVVVGIIDSGIDTTLGAFKDANGKSRIAYYWNQALENESGDYPTVVTPEGETRVYRYGKEYTAADIDAQTPDTVVSYGSEDGHGNHVAGTIGGRDADFPGMAPEIKYIFVVNDGEDSGDLWTGAGTGCTLDAYEYIISRAREMGLPLVVNQSQGTNMGPHDGSTLFEQALQNDIDDKSRNLITCISAGNSNLDKKSAELVIPPGKTKEINVEKMYFGPLDYDSVLYNSIDIWSKGSAETDMTMQVYYTDSTGTEFLLHTKDLPYSDSVDEETVVYEPWGDQLTYNIAKVFGSSESSLNGDDNILISGHTTLDGFVPVRLVLTFTNKSTTDSSHLNFYLQRNISTNFADEAVSDATISMPGTTPGAITVGCYALRNRYINNGLASTTTGYPGQTIDAISMFSSRGPVRNKRLYKGNNAYKPDIAAPGNDVISQCATAAYADAYNGGTLYQDSKHLVMSGTSMASPACCGLVALILQNMPNATADDIKSILFDGAKSDGYTGTVPNNIWGHGKIHADSLTSKKIVSPKPAITTCHRETASNSNLVIKGKNFVPACDVYINGVLWDSRGVEIISPTELLIHDVYSGTSPICKDKNVIVTEVKVVNVLGKANANTAILNLQENSNANGTHTDAGSGGCFIATAAYGSYLEPEVMQLRRFRDTQLITNAPGREFVRLYYTYSPPVADFIAQHPSARLATRLALTPLVYSVGHPTTAAALALVFGIGAGYGVIRRRRKQEEAK